MPKTIGGVKTKKKATTPLVKKTKATKKVKTKPKATKKVKTTPIEGKDVEFSRCNFVNTEINHDLNPPIIELISNNQDFKKIVALNLDQDEDKKDACDTYLSKIKILNDNSIVNMITGQDISYWSYTLPENVDTDFSPKIKHNTDSNKLSSQTNNSAKIMKCFKSNYQTELLKLFLGPEVNEHIFFIIDTGDDLIINLKKTTSSKNIHLHIIHSMVTIADSAPKTKPDSIKYTTTFIAKSNVFSHSWYYNQQFMIPANDKLFMSKYSITNACGLQWKITQTWSLGKGTIAYKTNDAHVDNNRTIIKNELVPLLLSEKTLTEPDKNKMNLNFQKKRSGDYLQILSAKRMPGLLASDPQSHFTHLRSSTNISSFGGNPTLIKTGDTNYYYSRTYFVTGDWPAMSYAIYNKVNCIMIVRNKDPSKSFVLRIKFN